MSFFKEMGLAFKKGNKIGVFGQVLYLGNTYLYKLGSKYWALDILIDSASLGLLWIRY